MGIALIGYDLPINEMGPLLFIFSYVIVNVTRYLMIIMISGIVNNYRSMTAISDEMQCVMWFSGFRGAMCKKFSPISFSLIFF